MKLVTASLTSLAVLKAQDVDLTEPKNAFCYGQNDVLSCLEILDSDEAAESLAFCQDKDASSENQATCFQAILDDSDQDEETYAAADFAMDEFLDGIGEDPMLQNVLAELNGLEAYLEANGVTRSINADGEVSSGVPSGEMDDQLNQAQDSVDGLKRFVELKQLVSWMQPKDKRISRYCFYGCWCLPEGAHSFVAGEGRPVDLVDKACQYLWFCYTCAKKDFTVLFGGRFKECVPDKQKYTFRFKYNKQKPADYSQRDIICKEKFYNPMNSVLKWKSNCARAICECDRGLAMRLYRSWRHWDKSRHRIWSQKVTTCTQLTACQQLTPGPAQQACIKRGCLFIVARRCLNCQGAGCGGNANSQNEFCCGEYPSDGGRIPTRDHGGDFKCCNHGPRLTGTNYPWHGTYYNQFTHTCTAGVVTPVAQQG